MLTNQLHWEEFVMVTTPINSASSLSATPSAFEYLKTLLPDRRSALLDPVYAPHPSARSTRLSSTSSSSASSSMSLRPRSISGP